MGGRGVGWGRGGGEEMAWGGGGGEEVSDKLLMCTGQSSQATCQSNVKKILSLLISFV